MQRMSWWWAEKERLQRGMGCLSFNVHRLSAFFVRVSKAWRLPVLGCPMVRPHITPPAFIAVSVAVAVAAAPQTNLPTE